MREAKPFLVKIPLLDDKKGSESDLEGRNEFIMKKVGDVVLHNPINTALKTFFGFWLNHIRRIVIKF